MMSNRLRRIKPNVPKLIWVSARWVRNYFNRLRALWNVTRYISGVSAKDKVVVVSSLLAAPFKLLASLDEWQDPVLVRDATVRSRNLGTFFIRGNTDDLVHVLPTHDPLVYATVQDILREGDVFIDGGANMGALSVLAARIIGERGSVLAVEMQPETFASLDTNIVLNDLGNVATLNRALSSKCGSTLTARVNNRFFGQASISQESRAFSEHGSESFEVETVTLDEAGQGYDSVALIKLDLEGHELLALQGAESLLQRTDNILFEHWGSGGDAEIEHLEARGFACKFINARNVLATKRC